MKQFLYPTKSTLFFCAFVFKTTAVFAQPPENHVFLKIDPINAFIATGTKTIYAKSASGPIAGSLTPRLEIAQVPDGFFIRTDFHVRKYNDNLKLMWEADLKKSFTLQAQPSDILIGDDKNCYFIEYAASRDISLNKVDAKGQVYQSEFKDGAGSPFILDNKLFLLNSKVEKKTKKIITTCSYIDYAKSSMISSKLNLPYSDYEHRAEASGNNTSFHGWTVTDKMRNEHELLKKVYFKDGQDSKKRKELIIETIEVDSKGETSNYLKWNFNAELIDDDRKFMEPNLAFDNVNNELVIFGYMSIDKNSLNGLYFLKFDYGSQDLLFAKEFKFSDILKSSDSKKTHSSIPKRVGADIPLGLSSDDYYINKKDKIFSIQIITNYRNTNTTYYEVKFDKYGDHVQTALVEYNTYNFNYPEGLKSRPIFHEILMKDTTRPHFINAQTMAEDFIISHAEESKSEVYTFPINRDTYSIALYYNEDKGEFSAIKLNRK